MTEAIINYAIYEDGSELLGTANVTLPDLAYLTQSIAGAGIPGNIEAVILGHIDAMTMSINFRTITDAAVSLSEPRRHKLDLRVAQQKESSGQSNLQTDAVKHVLVVIPKTDKGGSVAPASVADAGGDYAVHYWATYINGKCVREIDPINNKFEINGTDYLKDVRSALGK